LALIGVVENDRPDADDDYDGALNWSLKGDDGKVIADVFEAFRQTQQGWDEMWVYTSTSPPDREDQDDTALGEPTFRPTPQRPDELVQTW
jgi:hypothetical protein